MNNRLADMKIVFTGAIARPGQPAVGGVEASNRAIIDALVHRGVSVTELRYPTPDRHGGMGAKLVAYGFGLLAVAWREIVTAPRSQLLHVTSLYRHFIYPELAYVCIGRVLGKPVFFHIRGGDWLEQYGRRTGIYRWACERALKYSHYVAVQGKEIVPFVEEREAKSFYFPNFVTVPPRFNPRLEHLGDTIKLVYLGALREEKGVEVVLQTRRQLELSGKTATVRLIGAGDDAYVAGLRERYDEASIEWLGAIDHDRVRDAVGGSHFFVFPTRWHGEGQSNALTECMAEGVVPICSDHGFNKRMVADAGTVMDKYASAEQYADAIIDIWDHDQWRALSELCTKRVRDSFTADVVIDRLMCTYKELVDSR